MSREAIREYFESIYWPIKRRWPDFRRWPSNIARIIAWLPLLWKDRDWDFGFLEQIMIFKLERMQKTIGKSEIHVNNKRHARDIRITIEHLKRARDPEDYAPPMPEHKMEWERVPGRPTSRLKELPQPIKRQVRAWSKRISWIQDQHWQSAWAMIAKRGRTWWD